MNLEELFRKIEGSYFSANINVVSGFKVLLLALREDELLKELIGVLRESPENKQIVLERLASLLNKNDHPEYAHPYDAAITAYLYVLSQTDNLLTQQAIEHILQTPRLWWAAKLAKHLQETVTI